jgi:hypothetical protein
MYDMTIGHDGSFSLSSTVVDADVHPQNMLTTHARTHAHTQGMSLWEALKYARNRRAIIGPNVGFMYAHTHTCLLFFPSPRLTPFVFHKTQANKRKNKQANKGTNHITDQQINPQHPHYTTTGGS